MEKTRRLIFVLILGLVIINFLFSSNSIIEYTEREYQENLSLKISEDNLTENKQIFELEKETDNKTEETLEKKYFYLDIDEKESEKVLVSIVKEGKKELEFLVEPKDYDIEIKKEEKQIEKNHVKIRVYSNKHFNEEVIIYSDLPLEAKKEEIKVIWENEKKEINEETFDLKYYDENNNGLFDKLSWIIPHLSEQNFSIIITPINFNLSEQIEISVLNPTNEEIITHPLFFNIKVNYTKIEDLECNLSLNNLTYSVNVTNGSFFIWQKLPEGKNNWIIVCSDKNNNSISAIKSGNFSVPKLDLTMSKNYVLGKNFKFNLTGTRNGEEVNITLIKPNGVKKNYKVVHDGQEKEISASEIDLLGLYQINISFLNRSSPYIIQKTFQTVFIDFKVLNQTLDIEKNAEFRINISSPYENINYVKIIFASGRENTSGLLPLGTKNFTNYYIYRYENLGEFIPKIETEIGGEKIEVLGEKIITYTTKDLEKPIVNLISPKDEEVLEETIIDFIYKVRDNSKIANCTLKIYNATKSEEGGDSGKLAFPITEDHKKIATIQNPKNNSEIKLTLQNFAYRDYMWSVDCYDEFGNKNIATANYFKVKEKNLENSLIGEKNQKTEEIEEEIEKINEFMEKEKNMGADEKKAIEILGIITELKVMKNRLIQINNEISFTINNLKNETLKEKKLRALEEEIEKIKSKIPINFKVIEKKENENERKIELEKFMREYLEAEKIEKSQKEIKELIKNNKNIQSKLTTRNINTKVEIEYSNETKRIIIIEKSVKIDDYKDHLKVLEYLPDELNIKEGEQEFKTKAREIKENKIFEIEEKGSEKEIVYLIKKDLDIEEIKKATTIIFNPLKEEKSIFTGFVSFDIETNIEKIKGKWFFMVPLVLFLLLFYFMQKTKKIIYDPIEKTLNKIINEAKREIKRKNFEKARMNYVEIKKIYSSLEDKSKKKFYKEIEEIYRSLLKKEISELIKEYEIATRRRDTEKAEELFIKINCIYNKMNEKERRLYKEKIKKIPISKKIQ